PAAAGRADNTKADGGRRRCRSHGEGIWGRGQVEEKIASGVAADGDKEGFQKAIALAAGITKWFRHFSTRSRYRSWAAECCSPWTPCSLCDYARRLRSRSY